MSNVLQFLEAMGQSAALSRLSPEQYAKMVAELESDAPVHRALMTRNPVALGEALGGRHAMVCAIFAPDDDAPDDDRRGDEPDQEPDDEREER